MTESRTTAMKIVATLAILVIAAGLMAGCSDAGSNSASLPQPESLSQETTEVAIFYSTGRSLLEERHVVDSTDVYTSTLKELLLSMPESNADVAVVQTTAEFNSVTLEDGVLTIDWTPEVLDFEATDAEKRLARASFLATFGRFPEVEKVRFTVDGQEDGEVGGKDVRAFWSAVSLIDQPWDVLRIATSAPSDEASGSVEATATE